MLRVHVFQAMTGLVLNQQGLEIVKLPSLCLIMECLIRHYKKVKICFIICIDIGSWTRKPAIDRETTHLIFLAFTVFKWQIYEASLSKMKFQVVVSFTINKL